MVRGEARGHRRKTSLRIERDPGTRYGVAVTTRGGERMFCEIVPCEAESVFQPRWRVTTGDTSWVAERLRRRTERAVVVFTTGMALGGVMAFGPWGPAMNTVRLAGFLLALLAIALAIPMGLLNVWRSTGRPVFRVTADGDERASFDVFRLARVPLATLTIEVRDASGQSIARLSRVPITYWLRPRWTIASRDGHAGLEIAAASMAGAIRQGFARWVSDRLWFLRGVPRLERLPDWARAHALQDLVVTAPNRAALGAVRVDPIANRVSFELELHGVGTDARSVIAAALMMAAQSEA